LRLLLRFWDESEDKMKLDKVIESADKIINSLDTTKLAIHYGTKLDPDDPSATKARKEIDQQKEALVDALYRKGLAIAEKEDVKKHNPNFESNFNEIKKWIEVEDLKYVLLYTKYQRSNGYFGNSLKVLNKHLSSISGDAIEKKLMDLQIEVVEELGWNHWSTYFRKWKILKYPAKYPIF